VITITDYAYISDQSQSQRKHRSKPSNVVNEIQFKTKHAHQTPRRKPRLSTTIGHDSTAVGYLQPGFTKPVWPMKPIPTGFTANWPVFGSKFKFQIFYEESRLAGHFSGPTGFLQ
jgi:hypothetical protein